MTVSPLRSDPEKSSVDDAASFGPSWKINLLVIGGLLVVVLTYSLWQIAHLRKNFHNYSQEHARVVSGVIEQNTRTAVLAEDALRQTIQTFLGNTARFIDYLHSVEPFSVDELQAFAGETGLTAISILDRDGEGVSVDSGAFLPSSPACRQESVTYFPEKELYILTWPRLDDGCIVLGFSASQIEELHRQLRLPALLESLSALPGIKYVIPDDQTSPPLDTSVAEQRIKAGNIVLRVGFGTDRYTMRVRQIWRNVLIFSILPVCLGFFFSWLLYRYQSYYLNKMTGFERKLAREREAAALGRATATITHEIRNPLNAISMGLQRIELEAGELNPEHMQLAANMRQAVKRTNTIISDLLRYSRPISPRLEEVNLCRLIDGILLLYRNECDKKKINVRNETPLDITLKGDDQLLNQLFENLVKNAVEAQPDGGFISISTTLGKKHVSIQIENKVAVMPEDPTAFVEPYFTTKSRGTGLGLPFARRIAQAHGGALQIELPAKDVFRVVVNCPC